MDRQQEEDRKNMIRFAVHHILMLVMGLIIVAAIGYVYIYVQMQQRGKNTPLPPTPLESKGIAQPLPDFLLDGLKPNELEQLKP